ncbi:MAG: site-2 protease family protein [Dehalococcoidia bacterium]
MFGRSFQIARIAGIGIEVHPSWFLILAILVWSLSDSFLPEVYEGWETATYWVVGTVAALLLFVAVLIHEMAHALVAIRRGVPVPKITLFIFGGVSHLAQQPRTAGEEFAIAVAGPLTSVAIAVVAGAIWVVAAGRQEQVEAVAFYLAMINTLLAVFNTLPGFPLDGGRVLRSIVWRKTRSFRQATRVAGGVGEMFGWGLIFVGVLFLFTSLWSGLWFMLIGWFLLNAARAESQNVQLDAIFSQLTARDVMSNGFVTIPPGLDLQTVVDEHMLGKGERAVIVALGDTVQGILSVSDINKVPREDWPRTPAQRVMTPRAEIVTVDADTGAMQVLMLLAERRLNQVPVLDDGRLIGLVSRRELIDRVHLAEELGPHPDEPTPARV